jgi:hypothetical protein
MAATNDPTQLTGLLKNIYANGVVDAFSFAAPLASRLIKFDQQNAGLGNTYNQPVDLLLEHGITSAAANTTPTLVGIVAGQMQNATAEGAQMIGRSAVTYEMMARAPGQSQKSFESSVKRVTKRLALSHLKRLEMQLINGRYGMGVIESAASGGSGILNLVITAETWSAARWSAMVGAPVQITASDRTTIQAPATGAAASATITTVTPATRSIVVTCDDTDKGTVVSDSGNGGYIFLEPTGTKTVAASVSEMAGLEAWSRFSGSWFNINGNNYDLWNPNSYSTSTGVISFGKLIEAGETTGAYGSVQRLVAVCSLKAFSVLNTDIASLRQYDSSYSPAKASQGVKGIVFNTSVGELEILPHPLQADGIINIFAPDEALRVGAQDIDFVERGGNKLILESSTTPSGEMRTYSNQQLFVEQPRHMVRLAGITFG